MVGEGCWWLAMVWSRHGESTGVGCARWIGDNGTAGISTSRMQAGDGRRAWRWAASASGEYDEYGWMDRWVTM